jgi:hypothetical protein
VNFSQAPTQPNQIFSLIARTHTGRDLLTPFLALYRAGKVSLESYPPELLSRLRAVLGPGQPVGAAFTHDGARGVLHYDPSSPLGVLAPFFVHEIVHATDPELWAAARVAQTRKTRNQVILKAESRAFEIQHRFTEELRALDPAFAFFLENEQARVRILIDRLTQADIADLYGLDIT